MKITIEIPDKIVETLRKSKVWDIEGETFEEQIQNLINEILKKIGGISR